MIASTNVKEDFILEQTDECIKAFTTVRIFELKMDVNFISGISCLCQFEIHPESTRHWVDLFFLIGEDRTFAERIQNELDVNLDQAYGTLRLKIKAQKFGLG
jgi:hypothetical protein